MVKTYQIVLNNQRAKRMKQHLNNMGVAFFSGEVGGHQFIQFDYEENEITDIQTLIDEVKCYFWAKNIINKNKKEDYYA